MQISERLLYWSSAISVKRFRVYMENPHSWSYISQFFITVYYGRKSKLQQPYYESHLYKINKKKMSNGLDANTKSETDI
jgi:hypothetical protein